MGGPPEVSVFYYHTLHGTMVVSRSLRLHVSFHRPGRTYVKVMGQKIYCTPSSSIPKFGGHPGTTRPKWIPPPPKPRVPGPRPHAWRGYLSNGDIFWSGRSVSRFGRSEFIVRSLPDLAPDSTELEALVAAPLAATMPMRGLSRLKPSTPVPMLQF